MMNREAQKWTMQDQELIILQKINSLVNFPALQFISIIHSTLSLISDTYFCRGLSVQAPTSVVVDMPTRKASEHMYPCRGNCFTSSSAPTWISFNPQPYSSPVKSCRDDIVRPRMLGSFDRNFHHSCRLHRPSYFNPPQLQLQRWYSRARPSYRPRPKSAQARSRNCPGDGKWNRRRFQGQSQPLQASQNQCTSRVQSYSKSQASPFCL